MIKPPRRSQSRTTPRPRRGEGTVPRALGLCAVALLLAGGAWWWSAHRTRAEALVPGEERTVTLQAGETAVLELDLPENPSRGGSAYLVEAVQEGIDVVLELVGPDGATVTTVDRPFDRMGTERLWIDPGTRASRLRIVAREPGAPAGVCRVSIVAQADPDSAEGRAERFESDAAAAYHRGDPESLAASCDGFDRAADLWRDAREPGQETPPEASREAEALYAVAVLSRLVDDVPRALATGRTAQARWQALHQPTWEAAAWNELGLSSWLSGDRDAARRSFERARELQTASRDAYGAAVSSANLCLMDLDAGDLRAGLACYREAIARLHAVRALALEATATSNVGRVEDILGHPGEALGHYRRALLLVRRVGDRQGEARVLNNLGVLHRRLGEVSEALARYSEALDVFRALDDRRWQARVLNNLGQLYGYVGDLAKARLSLQQALPLWREVGDRRGEASTLTNLGLVAARATETDPDRDGALALYRQALELTRAAGDRQREAITLRQIGRLALDRDDPAGALPPLRSAAERFRALGDATGEALTLAATGEALSHLGRQDAAIDALERALRLARDAGHRPVEMVVLDELAHAERRAGHLDAARRRASEGVALVERLRGQIESTDLETTFGSTRHDLYQLEIELLMAEQRRHPEAPWAERAFVAAERARARTLLDVISQAGALEAPPAAADETSDAAPEEATLEAEDTARSAPADLAGLTERRRQLLRQLRVTAEASATRGGHGSAPGSPDLSAEEILRSLDLVEAQIRGTSPRYGDLTVPRPVEPAEARSLLDGRTLVLSYQLGRDRSFAWVLGRDRFDSVELPSGDRIERLARDLHARLSHFDPGKREEQRHLAERLADALLGPIAARLVGPDAPSRLVVVADGALHYVPFEVLPLPRPPTEAPEPAGPPRRELLIDRFEISYLPSVSVLATLRRTLAARRPAPDPLAILADPVFSADDPRLGIAPSAASAEPDPTFPRLRSSGREAAIIAALAPPGRVLLALGLDAGRRALADLARYRIVHFATHGVLDSDQPAASGLALSLVDAHGAPDPGGFLSLRDIYGLRLDADLVVLSGCRTAAGRTLRGEGLMGLARGFMYAGSPRVIASLWQVEDQATARLMVELYRGLWRRGERPADGAPPGEARGPPRPPLPGPLVLGRLRAPGRMDVRSSAGHTRLRITRQRIGRGKAMSEQPGHSIQSFVGEFVIRNGSGVGNVIEAGDTLYIGTGNHLAPPVDGNRVGVSIFADDGNRRFPSEERPAYFTFRGGRLEFESPSVDGLQMTIVLSLYQAQRNDGTFYRAPYGLVVLGDPDQVGAWGADDNPNQKGPVVWG